MKKLLILILIVIGSFQAFAKKNMVWRVESPSSRIYIMGSVHVADSSFYPLDSKVLKAFDSSSTLYVEVDINKINPMSLLAKALFQSDTMTLKKAVPEKYYKIFSAAFDSAGVPKTYYDKFRPWFAAMSYTQLEFTEQGFGSAQGIDMYFLDLAKELNKKIAEMETPDSQIALLESFDDKIESFMDYSEKTEGVASNPADLIEFWKQGDDINVEKFLNNYDKNDSNMVFIMNKLLYERNDKMTDKIQSFLDDKEKKIYYIVVGAGHVVGEKGIVEKLKKLKKYKISRL